MKGLNRSVIIYFIFFVIIELAVFFLNRHKEGKKPETNSNEKQTRSSSNQSKREQKYANISGKV